MKILHRVEEIRDAVMDVLSDASSDRYAFVAFVGRHPLRWLPDPEGLQVYCWPRAGGTNPEGIDALVNAGVKVHFKESMHSKVYHSDLRGTVIGSANLTDNALGTGRLTETAIKLPVGLFSIHEQLKQLQGAVTSGSPAFNAIMDKLRLEHVAYYQRNPELPREKRTPEIPLTFGQWAELNPDHRSPWQLALWSGQYDPPQDVLNEFKEAGGEEFSNWRAHFNEKNINVGVATLDCQYRANEWGIKKNGAHWWFPEAQRPTKESSWEENPHVWFARVNVPTGLTVPFDCTEGRFLGALDKAVAKFGDRIEHLEGPVQGTFLDLLKEEYSEGKRGLSSDALDAIFRRTQQVDRSESTLKQSTDHLVQSYGLTRNSAVSIIRSVRHMLNGELYQRRLTIQITEYVLKRINEEYGQSGLRKALGALRAHILYLKSVKQNASGLEALLEKFKQKRFA